MTRSKSCQLLMSLCVLLMGTGCLWAQKQEAAVSVKDSVFAKQLKSGRSTQVDPGFDYFKNRSPESIASEVALNGYDSVYYMVFSDKMAEREMVDAFHRWGVAVWGGFHANGIYVNPDEFPPEADQWKIQYTDPDMMKDYSGNFSFIHEGFHQWFKDFSGRILDKAPFDGFLIVEPLYSSFGGLDRDPVQYGDISPAFQAAFKAATGNTRFPSFTNPDDPLYYKKPENKKLYEDLVEYRVRVMVEFCDDVINGEGGIRSRFPGLVIGTWTLGSAEPDGYRRVREEDGEDAEWMVRDCKPDVHYIQTHWPDWTRPDLPTDYVKGYADFIQAVRRADPNVAIGFQADVGSLTEMRKNPQWVDRYHEACLQAGVDVTTYYMFSLRWEVYYQPPRPLIARCGQQSSQARIYFDQVIDPQSAQGLVGREVVAFHQGNKKYPVRQVEVDGNILMMTVEGELPAGQVLSFPVGGVSDLPAVRFQQSAPVKVVPDSVNAIPDFAFTSLTLEPAR